MRRRTSYIGPTVVLLMWIAGGVLLGTTASLAAAPVTLEQANSTPPQSQNRQAARQGARARMGMPARPANPDMMTVQQVEQYFDQFVLFQAQTRLELTDAQFLKFGAALRQLQDARRVQQRQRMQTLRALNDLLSAAEPDDAQITARIKDLDDLTIASSRRVQDAYGSIDGALTLRQRARFRVFEENMERRKLDLLARARRQPPPQEPPAAPTR